MTIIPKLPTLCNPDLLGLAELREQYKLLEGDAIDQNKKLSDACAKLHSMCNIAEELGQYLHVLCDSYDAGDQAAILLQVKKLAERRAKQKARVH